MERFWVTWPAGADVAAAYEIRIIEDRIGGRAEARVQLAHGQIDLARRHGPGRLAG
jgi:hypothetical protein